MGLRLDHLVFAAPDLESGIQAVEALVGVRAAFGGKHDGLGTHNALLSLGEDAYLEIIAPDPEQPEPSRPLPFGLPGLTKPRLATWAARADEIEDVVVRARQGGYDPGAVIAMTRDRPDGVRLSWRLALRTEPSGDGLVPFLIDWDPGPHPAETSPAGCGFVSLRGEHPDPRSITAMLDALGADLPVMRSPAPRLIATIRGQRGTVEIS
jgi:hypothetical protein